MSNSVVAAGQPLNSMAMPSIGIVTICKNAGATIERTLESVAQCDYEHLQYVVVDGGSTDNTFDVVERYGSYVDKFISGPDAGISDALNKGVELTDCDYHLIVHADDTLSPDSLAIMARRASEGDARVVCGSVLVTDGVDVVRKFAPDPRKLVTKMSVPHMGSLIRRDVWEEVGKYDLRRKIAMDHLLMLRILRRFGVEAFSVVDAVVANYYLGGVSDRHIIKGFLEVRENLIEEGIGTIRANIAYVELVLKAELSRLIGKRRICAAL